MKHYPRIILFPVTTISVSGCWREFPMQNKATRILKHPATVPTNSSHHLRPARDFELKGGGDPLVGPNLPTFVLKPANFLCRQAPGGVWNDISLILLFISVLKKRRVNENPYLRPA